jgi:hypothetical protein
MANIVSYFTRSTFISNDVNGYCLLHLHFYGALCVWKTSRTCAWWYCITLICWGLTMFINQPKYCCFVSQCHHYLHATCHLFSVAGITYVMSAYHAIFLNMQSRYTGMTRINYDHVVIYGKVQLSGYCLPAMFVITILM